MPVDPRESVTTAADTKARSPRPRSRSWALQRRTEAAVQAWPRREPEGGVTPGERNARAGEDVALSRGVGATTRAAPAGAAGSAVGMTGGGEEARVGGAAGGGWYAGS